MVSVTSYVYSKMPSNRKDFDTYWLQSTLHQYKHISFPPRHVSDLYVVSHEKRKTRKTTKSLNSLFIWIYKQNFYSFYETSPISLLSISCICSYQCLRHCFHLATGTSYQIDFQSLTELILDDSIASNRVYVCKTIRHIEYTK